MNYILFDELKLRQQLLPFTFTRSISGIRSGILSMGEKWSRNLGIDHTFVFTEDYLMPLYDDLPLGDSLFINAAVSPEPTLLEKCRSLNINEVLTSKQHILAFRTDEIIPLEEINKESILEKGFKELSFEEDGKELLILEYSWDIFSKNEEAIKQDFQLMTKGQVSAEIPENVNFTGDEIFIEEGAKINFSNINAASGPVYIGKNAEIMEGSMIRGPFALCDNSVVKMGAKIYGPTTIGPFSKVGGEINNSVIFGYSNKAHDGFLGNSVIGEWCNLGADTNCSNLKNNYGHVKAWSYKEEKFVSSGRQFLGLIMGDHSKCGINTMFNTGTTVGVSSNIFGASFPEKYIPSFSWGGDGKWKTYVFDVAMRVARVVMQRRNKSLTDEEHEVLKQVFNITKEPRGKLF